MLTEIYIEALLVNEELADQVQEALEVGVINDLTAFLAWFLIAKDRSGQWHRLIYSRYCQSIICYLANCVF